MRQKIKKKNLKYYFFRIDKEKSIKIFNDGGWHFNNVMEPEQISLKLKSFAHTEFDKDEYTSIKNIREKIDSRIDLFGRNHKYEKITLDKSFPKYILDNQMKLKKFIL
jgi:beta-1,4-mannosyl-glycoprotein beta-1,4-N-acetylglucosaminyltransferase